MNGVLQHIIVCFDPLSIILGHEPLTKPFKVQGRDLKGPSWGPWLTMPDILFASVSRTFLGVSCSVPEKNIDYVRQLCLQIDSDAVRLNNPKDDSFPLIKGQDDSCRFEIIWGIAEPDTLQVAQLSEAEWYYAEGNFPNLPFVSNNLTMLLSSENVSVDTDHLEAFGLVDVDEILAGYSLIMPDLYRLTQKSIKNGILV